MSLSFPQIINLEAWSVETLAEHLPEEAKSRAKEIANFVRGLKLSTEEDEGFTLDNLSNKFDSTLVKQLAGNLENPILSQAALREFDQGFMTIHGTACFSPSYSSHWDVGRTSANVSRTA